MLAALEIPEGQIVERLNGRDGALKEMLDNVKKYSFSGYVKVGLALEGDQSEGIILFNSGDPVLALYLYKREGMGQERIYKAARAVEFLYEDSVYPEAVLSLHGRVDPEKVGRVLPSAEINRAELMPPPWIPKPFQPLDRDKLRSEKEDIAKKMIAWSKEGIDVSRLLELYLADTKKAARALPYFESNIERMRELKEKLQFMKTEGFEREAESIRRRTADPERIVEAETELAALRRRVERSDETVLAEKQIQQEMERKKQDERIDGVYDLILQYHKMSSSGVPKRTRCPTCGGPLDQSGNCPRCLGEAEQRPAFGTPLNPRFTFEKFVTGPSSRFAEAAAKAVAANPGSVYNPLFLYSRSGLGKTHLLQAVGNHAREARPELRLLCSSIEAFERELIDSLAAKKLEEFRAAYRGAELLLLDDIQFLAGKERIQEELFHTFNVVVEKGGQIVLACDRLPKE
ncbi:MAG: hypothetical protein FJ151_03290, partial [Euryarchaeota archaeon]|nr:hypothetical protein [Euryarchaeota archaeon]